MKITFIGYGKVGAPLADHLQRLGHDVTLAVKEPGSSNLAKALSLNAQLKTLPPAKAVADADVVFLATPYESCETALASVKEEIKDKIVIDCTNPVGADLCHGLNSRVSGSETIQQLAPQSNVIKAFTIYGYENFEDNAYQGYNVAPAMMYCGDNEKAKETVEGLIMQLGWEPLDVGGLEQALHLEHMTLLWVRMVRVNGASPHMVWARLKR